MNETLVNLLRLFGEPFVAVQPNLHFQTPAGKTSNLSASVPCVLSGCDKMVPTDNSWIVGRPEIDIRVCYYESILKRLLRCTKTHATATRFLIYGTSFTIHSLLFQLPFETPTRENSVTGGCFCRKHGQLVLPAFAAILRSAINRPKPKEKIIFSIRAPDQNGDPEENENVAVGALPNPADALNHLQGAFVRPRDLNAAESNFAEDIFDDFFDVEFWF